MHMYASLLSAILSKRAADFTGERPDPAFAGALTSQQQRVAAASAAQAAKARAGSTHGIDLTPKPASGMGAPGRITDEPKTNAPATPAINPTIGTNAKTGMVQDLDKSPPTVTVQQQEAASAALAKYMLDEHIKSQPAPKNVLAPTPTAPMSTLWDKTKNYASGFNKNPTQWDGSHIAAAAGAGALAVGSGVLLAHLLKKRKATQQGAQEEG